MFAENQKRLPSPYEANNIQKRQSRNSKLLAFALERNQNKTKIITVYDIICILDSYGTGHWTIPKRSFLHLASLLGHLLLVFSRFQNDRIGPTLPCKFTINGEPTRKRGFEKQWLVNLSGILAEPASMPLLFLRQYQRQRSLILCKAKQQWLLCSSESKRRRHCSSCLNRASKSLRASVGSAMQLQWRLVTRLQLLPYVSEPYSLSLWSHMTWNREIHQLG